MKQNLINTGKWLLVILFMSYYLSATCFYHTHHYSWGTVTHSHLSFPFDGNPAHHSHTQNQCQTIQFLSQIVLIFLVAVSIFKIMKIKPVNIPVHYYKTHLHHINSPLRAPPVF